MKKIAVVGGGIAGMCVSALLRKQGHSVTVFEQSSALEPVGAGVMLQPSGQLVLKSIGLLDSVIKNSEPIHELHAIQRDGRTLIRMPFSAANLGMHAYGVHRHDIFQVLASKAKDEGVEFVMDANIVGAVDDKSNIKLSDKRGTIWSGYDHTIICNGSRSSLRQLPRYQEKGYEYHHGAIWFLTEGNSFKGKLLQIVDGSDKLMGILPLGLGRISLFWGIRCSEAEALMRAPIEAWKDSIRKFYPAATPLLDSIHSWDQARYGTYRNKIVRNLYSEKHIFLGDAAHSMSPHLGQGLNMALLDAFHFAVCFAQEKSWMEACRSFRKTTARQLRYYRWVTGLLAPYFQSDSSWRGSVRDGVLPWLHHLPFVRGQMALTMAGMKKGFLGGRMSL